VVEVSFIAGVPGGEPTRIISFGLLVLVTAAAHNTGQLATCDDHAVSTTGEFPQ
jgi:hypothetical protein